MNGFWKRLSTGRASSSDLARLFIFPLFVSKVKPYGNTVKPGIMKYYAIYVSKIDWNDHTVCSKFVACICSERYKEKCFLEKISITKEIYHVSTLLQENGEKCCYIDTDGLLHKIECEGVIIYH